MGKEKIVTALVKKYRYLIVLILIGLDQLSKFIVRDAMYVGQTIPIIKKIFSITYVQNRGAAFGIFTGQGTLLVVITFVALGFAVWYMEKHIKSHYTLHGSLQLIIAGGVGNIIDRISLGFVTDMFDFKVWPVFNIADICVCVGCGLLILYMFKYDDNVKKDSGDTNEQGTEI